AFPRALFRAQRQADRPGDGERAAPGFRMAAPRSHRMNMAKAENRARFGVPADSMVFARGVRKSYGTLEVLKGVDLDVPLGSVACIIGPSGSGKSTFLRCINHLEKLSGGILLVDSEFV